MEPIKTKLEEQISFILMKSGVTGPEIDEAIEWGFGKGAWYEPPYPNWLSRWNSRHPEVPVKKTDNFVEFIFVVGHLFLKDKMRKSGIRK